MEENGYRKLIVYQKSKLLVKLVYEITNEFPKSEMFGLISQIRRCAISVCANIVEGWARKGKKEKLQFYYISRGSLTELEFYIDISLELGFINEKQYQKLLTCHSETARVLNGFIKAQENYIKNSSC